MNHIVEYKHVKAKMYRASWDRNRKIAKGAKREKARQKGKDDRKHEKGIKRKGGKGGRKKLRWHQFRRFPPSITERCCFGETFHHFVKQILFRRRQETIESKQAGLLCP